jgi:hypothetical protein
VSSFALLLYAGILKSKEEERAKEQEKRKGRRTK